MPQPDKTHYRNRKYNISVNVLAMCDRNMKFVYVLTGWEGSVADNKVLRDIISRPNGLRFSTSIFEYTVLLTPHKTTTTLYIIKYPLC